MKPEPEVVSVLADIVAAGAAEDRNVVLLFCNRMFEAVFYERSNCKKASLFTIFQAAAEDVACKTDDPSVEKFCERVAQADLTNGAYFKDAIVDAFLQSKFNRWTELREAIKKQEAEEALQEVRRRLYPVRPKLMDPVAMHLMLKRCPTRRKRR